jgi:hypothetical protein
MSAFSSAYTLRKAGNISPPSKSGNNAVRVSFPADMACTGGRIPQDSTHLPNALRRVREGTCGACAREHSNGDFSWRLESDSRTRHIHCGGGNMTVEVKSTLTDLLLYACSNKHCCIVFSAVQWRPYALATGGRSVEG